MPSRTARSSRRRLWRWLEELAPATLVLLRPLASLGPGLWIPCIPQQADQPQACARGTPTSRRWPGGQLLFKAAALRYVSDAALGERLLGNIATGHAQARLGHAT